MELERIVHSQGFGSRKQSRVWIAAGRVKVNGQIVDNPRADFPLEGLSIQVDDIHTLCRQKVYLVLNKPAGFECSHQPQHHASVFSLLPAHYLARGVQSVGRLDADTTGLLLFTDDGPLLHALTSPRRHVPKCYEVQTADPVDDSQLSQLLAGVVLRDDPQPVAALSCEQLSTHALRLTIDQGRYHQVKRMLAAVGNRVVGLHRMAMGGLVLPEDLAQGAWRELTPEELVLACQRETAE